MKTALGMAFVVLALGMTSATARAQSPVVGELSKGLSNPTAGPIPDPATTREAKAVENGALPGDSHVRIVRLSDVKGQLSLDRKTGLGFEQTMQNMPIVEGEKLRTADGYAEVEFEDNSTMRLAPNSQVDFSLLALRSTGAKASTMNVVRGTVYVSTESTKGNEFVLEAGDAKMAIEPSTHLRLEVQNGKTVLSVFNGNVAMQHDGETTVVAKKESLTLDEDQVAVAKKVEAEPYDAWDKESIDYHVRYANANTFAGSGNAFGLSDLNYYGSFINGGAFGSFWQPYFIGSGWSPYGNGLWAFYPDAGYSWVSPYPWGWLPYHSGLWSFYPGYGWGWQPGGTWNGLNNVVPTAVQTSSTGTIVKGVSSPLRAAALPQAPAATVSGATRPSLVLANQSPIVFSKEDKPGNFVFQKDSAGLGVPRGSLGSLNKISANVERNGFASMPVYAAPAGGMDTASRGANRGASGPMTLRAASPAAERGNQSAYSEARSGSNQGTAAAQSGTASHSGGGFSQPSGGAAPMSSSGNSSSGGAHSSGASPK